MPYPLAIGYAIALAISGKAKTLKLGGFDGYNKSSPETDNTEQLLELFVKKKFKKKIISFTRTRYKSLKYEKP